MEGDTVRYKNNKIEPPEIHLGTKLKEKTQNGCECWIITSIGYAKAAVQTTRDPANTLAESGNCHLRQ